MAIANWLEVVPPLNTRLVRYMLEGVDVLIRLQSPYPPSVLQVQVWTNLPTPINAEGNWYAIDLEFRGIAMGGSAIFQTSLRPTSTGAFDLTYRVRHRQMAGNVQWMGRAGDNVRLQIESPAPNAEWTQRPNPVEIMPRVYVGNFMAASLAASLGFDAVLNMAAELNPTFAADRAIAYRKLPCQDGAHHPIPQEYLQAAVEWIDQQLADGKRRILVHCRAGIGRSGSVGVAYCFYEHPHWSYTTALDYVLSRKPEVYPHRRLQPTLERLFPRQEE